MKPVNLTIPFVHPRKATTARYLASGIKKENIFRTDRGDVEGEKEWSEGRINGCNDKRGDDNIEITLTQNGNLIISYLKSTIAC